MGDVTITPAGVVAGAGDTVAFTANLTADLKDAKYSWKRDGVGLDADSGTLRFSNNGQTLTISPVGSDHEGAYTVTITTSDGKVHEAEAPAVLAVRGQATAEWDDLFTGYLVAIAIFLLLGIGWPLFWALGTSAHQQDFVHTYPTLVAFEFLLVGVVLVLASIFIAMLEVRGRSRKAEAPSPLETLGADTVKAIAEAVPESIKAWGGLKVTAALLLAALGLFAGGATLAWKATGGTTTTTTTTTSTTTTSGGTTTTGSTAAQQSTGATTTGP